MPASQAPQPSATPSPTRTRRSKPWSTPKLKINTTASIAIFALAAHAGEREAHTREIERSGADWPEGSYGRRNRQAIAARETRITTRLRAVQHAYQTVAGHDTAYTPPEPNPPIRAPGPQASRQIELEAEP
jgi:hypothetical protein